MASTIARSSSAAPPDFGLRRSGAFYGTSLIKLAHWPPPFRMRPAMAIRQASARPSSRTLANMAAWRGTAGSPRRATFLGRARGQSDRTAPCRNRQHRDGNAEGGERPLDRAAATSEGECRDLGIRWPGADIFTKRGARRPATDDCRQESRIDGLTSLGAIGDARHVDEIDRAPSADSNARPPNCRGLCRSQVRPAKRLRGGRSLRHPETDGGDGWRNAEAAREARNLQFYGSERKIEIDRRAKLINPGGPHLRHPDDGGPLRF